MKMWKMPLLDKCHLLIKFHSSEQNDQASYFVVYITDTTEVLAVSENTFHQARRLGIHLPSDRCLRCQCPENKSRI